MEKISCIYEIVNLVNGKKYIGSAVNFKQRKGSHLSRLRRGVHHSPSLQNSYVKHGEISFEFKILEEVSNTEFIMQREQYYLDVFKTYDPKIGYNICKVAGSTIGTKQSEETIKKRAESHRGRKVSPEGRLRMSEAAKLRGVSQHVIDNLIKVRPKGPISEAHREKIRASSTGRLHSLESRRKMSEVRKGVSISVTDKVLESRKGMAEKIAVLSRDQVLEIRKLVLKGESMKELSKIYSCSYSTLCNSVWGKGIYGTY